MHHIETRSERRYRRQAARELAGTRRHEKLGRKFRRREKWSHHEAERRRSARSFHLNTE